MKVIEKMADKARESIRSFLRIEPAQRNTFYISEVLDFESNAIKNRIWYRGDADELQQLYKSLPGESSRTRFWAAVPTAGREIRKIHTGLPSIIIDTISNIVLTDMNKITPEGRENEWDEIAEDNNIQDLIEDAVGKTLYIGDGAFKVSLNTDITACPIIEFVPGDKISVKYRYGRVYEIIFKTIYTYNSQVYVLYETYGYGYITYELRKNNKEVPMDSIPDTSQLRNITFTSSFMLAVHFKIFNSPKWEGRGKSIFDGKTDNFDALDECWSQWMDALRKGRSKEYIPSDMLPRDPRTGELMKPNPFDNAYIEHESPMTEGQAKKIELIQPEIPHESYLSSYVTCLDMCLQGVISPSTLGIDGNKLKDDTATAQMEREKVTLYTRNKIIEAMRQVIPELVNICLKAVDTMNNQVIKETKVTIDFGEYNSPGFDAVIDTVGKAKQSGIMSIEAAVDELYGDRKDENWKAEEVLRLKAELGISEMQEPAVNEEVNNPNDTVSTGGGGDDA